MAKSASRRRSRPTTILRFDPWPSHAATKRVASSALSATFAAPFSRLARAQTLPISIALHTSGSRHALRSENRSKTHHALGDAFEDERGNVLTRPNAPFPAHEREPLAPCAAVGPGFAEIRSRCRSQDGRASTMEAIAWHTGEAEDSHARFERLARGDRAAVWSWAR